MAYFTERWDLHVWAPAPEVARAAVGSMQQYYPRTGWEIGEGATDFITTLRQGLEHAELNHLPTANPDALWPIGTMTDAPAASDVTELRFTCERPAQFHVQSMPSSFIIRDDNGSMLWDGGVPVAGRARKQLEQKYLTEIARCYHELQKLRKFRSRGAACCSISK